MSKEDAEKMLEALQQREKKLARKITKKKRKRTKDQNIKRLVN